MIIASKMSAFRLLTLALGFATLLDVASSNEYNKETYWDLAERTCGPAFAKALQLLPTLNKDSRPNTVKHLRFAFLEARELMDMFSFAYPLSNKNNDGIMEGEHQVDGDLESKTDFWHEMRKDLDRGYELIGIFQDLAHSLVEYNETDVATRLAGCLEWKDQLVKNERERGYLHYITHPSKNTLYKHDKISRLFWGYKGHVPKYGKSGYQNLAIMLRDCQLAQLSDNYTRLLKLDTIWELPEHDHFHSYRKMIRSVLAVLQFFPQIVPQPSEEVASSGQDGPALVAPTSTLPKNSNKDSLSNMVDAGTPTPSSISPHRKLAASGHAQSQAIAATAAVDAPKYILSGNDEDEGDDKDEDGCHPWKVRNTLADVKLGLGDINDKIFAWMFYKENDNLPAAEASLDAAKRDWAILKDNMRDWKFDQRLVCLESSLPK